METNGKWTLYRGLLGRDYFEELEVIQKKYLKGERGMLGTVKTALAGDRFYRG